MKDIRQTNFYSKYIQEIGWKVSTLNGVNIFKKDIPLLGTFIKIQRFENLSPAELYSFTKNLYPFQIVVEPLSDHNASEFINNGFTQMKEPYVPSKTQVINLTKPLEKILSECKKDTRYAIRKSSSVRVIETSSPKQFYEIYKSSVRGHHVVLSLKNIEALKKCFGKKCILLITDKNDAGGIFIYTNKYMYYWVGFTNNNGRKRLSQYQIIWHAITKAHKLKLEKFDLEGIFDGRFPNKSWKGFTHFKKSFGGEEVIYPGALTKIDYFAWIKKLFYRTK